MYKNIFDNHLSSNKTFAAYMFWGQNNFLIDSYALKTALLFTDATNIQKVYFDEYDYEKCLDILSQSSLFVSTNILLIKISKKILKKEIDSLINACVLNDNSHVIFSCFGNADFKTMAKSFTIKTNSAEVRFFTPNTAEAISILNDEALKKKVSFEQEALLHLYDMHEKDLSLCISDINKLAILDESISTKTIQNQCFGVGTVSLDDFMLKFFSNQYYNDDLYKLLEEGISEVYLINQLTSFAQQLFLINSYLKLHGTLNIIEIWGYPLPKEIAHNRTRIAVKFNHEQFKFILNRLLGLELEIKNSKIADLNAYTQASIRKLSASIR
ncbi:hypothetical protein MNB_ARC-1_426 [hydrothermal vent metagenome]|uniref:Uncharacterized protein n=1 Tax=hydrothermal vent metagenome TaxID=652676 RepID=A0A3B1EA75_9ZZZZ